MSIRPNKRHGFTLTELMVTVAVIGLLISLAGPSFRDMIARNRTATAANQLVTTLAFGRSEAIKRGVQITIKRKGNVAQAWEEGWDVFVDYDGDGTLDDDGNTTLCDNGEDCLVRTYDALPPGYTLRTGETYADWMAYLPDGTSRGSGGFANDTFRLCDRSRDNTQSREIVLNNAGRYRTKTGTEQCP